MYDSIETAKMNNAILACGLMCPWLLALPKQIRERASLTGVLDGVFRIGYVSVFACGVILLSRTDRLSCGTALVGLLVGVLTRRPFQEFFRKTVAAARARKHHPRG